MMRDTDPSSPKATKKRRSRIACKRCHDRRVRCDVSVIGTPCSGCTASNLDLECQILNSKRVRGGNGRFSTRDVPEMPQRPLTPLESISGQTEREENPPSPEETEDSGSTSQQVPADETDIWSRVVSYQTRLPSDGQRVVYVGEPWTLAYVMQWKGRQRQGMADVAGSPNGLSTESPTAVHVSVPIENHTSPDSQLQSQSSTTTVSTANASNLPADIQRALIKSYFSRHNILYPVLDNRRFSELSRSHTVDPCLHLAVLYAGALHVPDPIIYRAGFDSRQACLISLYRRAKHIFFQNDDDGTVDQLSYIQSAFLLHNMWQGPNATLNPWTWLGLAIRMAQNIGMHRSTQSSSLPEADKRLWKRIWWCLYTRDRQIASALGKPLMIRDEDCDVEPLTLGEFEEGDSEQTKYFVIEQARLSILCASQFPKFSLLSFLIKVQSVLLYPSSSLCLHMIQLSGMQAEPVSCNE
ncbi:unnamed protein product [Clonostachys solani]|uniref:Zn(2)-C6 fungal-type domain-containing protein n=1 Tax=Clonostachys solani TaxID=160281 RepID=A0A9P0ENS5_9HYPO|nr:unnamed protein product [Clonostachys solani]